MPDHFQIAFNFTVGQEGGYSQNPADPGNWTGGSCGVGLCNGTNFGISAASYPDLNIAALTLAQAEQIYRDHYWAPVRGDQLPLPLAMAAFDGAVNSGVGQSVQWLQSAAGVYQDGIIGPITLGALQAGNTKSLLREALVQRLMFLSSLQTFQNFGLGWTRRVMSLLSSALGQMTYA